MKRECSLCRVIWFAIKVLAILTIACTSIAVIYLVSHSESATKTVYYIVHPEDEQIDASLKTLENETHADRVTFSRFHKDNNIVYISRMNEVDGNGVPNNLSYVKDIPVGGWIPAIKKQINGECYITEDTAVETNSAVSQFYIQYGVHSVVMYPVMDSNNFLLGFVAVEWIKPLTSNQILAYIDNVKDISHQVEQLIN